MYAYMYTHVLTHFIQSAGGFVETSVRRRRRWWRSQTGPAFGCRVGGGGIRPLACSPLGGLPLHPVGQEEVVTRGLVAAMVGAMDGGISIGTWPCIAMSVEGPMKHSNADVSSIWAVKSLATATSSVNKHMLSPDQKII